MMPDSIPKINYQADYFFDFLWIFVSFVNNAKQVISGLSLFFISELLAVLSIALTNAIVYFIKLFICPNNGGE